MPHAMRGDEGSAPRTLRKRGRAGSALRAMAAMVSDSTDHSVANPNLTRHFTNELLSEETLEFRGAHTGQEDRDLEPGLGQEEASVAELCLLACQEEQNPGGG